MLRACPPHADSRAWPPLHMDPQYWPPLTDQGGNFPMLNGHTCIHTPPSRTHIIYPTRCSNQRLSPIHSSVYHTLHADKDDIGRCITWGFGLMVAHLLRRSSMNGHPGLPSPWGENNSVCRDCQLKRIRHAVLKCRAAATEVTPMHPEGESQHAPRWCTKHNTIQTCVVVGSCCSTRLTCRPRTLC